ncbi:MAG: MBL fold metallo-hydrolase [Oscillospiraceae bacterium]|nr:MBL fold metallo-hydrolase [Oscillospiraceae bacterium]
MHCIRKVTEDLVWVGSNDRKLLMFEGVYSVPKGVAYNSYLLLDEKTVLFDTVDNAVRNRFFENLEEALGGKTLDYLVIQHMEPDHTSAIIELAEKHPGMKIVCNAKSRDLLKQYFDFDIESRVQLVKEGDTLETGKHALSFIMAPMIHWPEVMMTYDSTSHILYSADAFGCFGALNGALFADEVDFDREYMDEARRYYANIVGKYGNQVMALLKKVSSLQIDIICPLHGFVWRKDIDKIIEKHALWALCAPEERGVMIAYASVYGNTENAAEILSCKLQEAGVRTAMYDVSVTMQSEIVAAAFKWSHIVFASTTYNAGIFVTMEAVINDITAHNLRNRTVGIIENGSWAPTSGGLIRESLEKCENICFLDKKVTLKSSLKKEQLAEIEAMAEALIATLQTEEAGTAPQPQTQPEEKKGFVCSICGYEYEGETLPEDFICPLCKNDASVFEPM